MWCDDTFSQRNKATKIMGKRVGQNLKNWAEQYRKSS